MSRIQIAASRVDRLESMLNSGLVVRHQWQNGTRACLLGALFPEAAEAKNERACPDNEISPWFASFVRWMGDNVTASRWGELTTMLLHVLRAEPHASWAEWVEFDQDARAALAFTTTAWQAWLRSSQGGVAEVFGMGGPRGAMANRAHEWAGGVAGRLERAAWSAMPTHASATGKASAKLSEEAADYRVIEALTESRHDGIARACRWINLEHHDPVFTVLYTLNVSLSNAKGRKSLSDAKGRKARA